MRNLSNVSFSTIIDASFLEIDQELASMDLMSRAERKKEFISNKQTLVEKR